MDNVSVCPICGKEFEQTSGLGRKRVYCSEKCKSKRDNKASVDYIRNRYQTDEEFRNRKKNNNNEYSKRRNEVAKRIGMRKLAVDVLKCHTPDEAYALLAERTRLKSEYYEYGIV